jgi:hypothetical protein
VPPFIESERSSVVELYLAKVDVVGSNPIARSIFFAFFSPVVKLEGEGRQRGSMRYVHHAVGARGRFRALHFSLPPINPPPVAGLLLLPECLFVRCSLRWTAGLARYRMLAFLNDGTRISDAH